MTLPAKQANAQINQLVGGLASAVDVTVRATLAITLSAALLGCKGGSTTSNDAGDHIDDAPAGLTCQELETRMRAALDAAAIDPAITMDPDFTIMLEADDGRRFTHSHGTSTPTTVYRSASTSKWVTAAVLLDLVDQGVLSLDEPATDQITFWNETSVTLRHLLSLTSGFSEEAYSDTAIPVSCLERPNYGFAMCVKDIYDVNLPISPQSGTKFFYSSTHMQVAGLMAMRASDLPTWSAVFDAWKARTNLFPTSEYDLPSTTNPLLAGGMHWTGEEYLAFLRALRDGTILSPTARTAMFANQRGTATVGYSPLSLLDEDWGYGLGNWLECRTATTPGSFDCGDGHRNSSPGTYGAYPFIDFDNHYIGIVARQGVVASFAEGIRIGRTIEDDAALWATRQCE